MQKILELNMVKLATILTKKFKKNCHIRRRVMMIIRQIKRLTACNYGVNLSLASQVAKMRWAIISSQQSNGKVGHRVSAEVIS